MGSFYDFRVERGARIMHSLSEGKTRIPLGRLLSIYGLGSNPDYASSPYMFLFKWDFASKESNISFPLQFKRRERLKMEHPPPPRHNGFRRGGGKEERAFIPILPFHYFFQRIGMSGRIMVRNGNLSNSKLQTTLFGVRFAALFSIH